MIELEEVIDYWSKAGGLSIISLDQISFVNKNKKKIIIWDTSDEVLPIYLYTDLGPWKKGWVYASTETAKYMLALGLSL